MNKFIKLLIVSATVCALAVPTFAATPLPLFKLNVKIPTIDIKNLPKINIVIPESAYPEVVIDNG